MRILRALVVVLVCTLAPRVALAQTSTEELKRMSLRDVLDIEVTTVSREPEQAIDVPAAVFVITQEDIRRSGATSIPEALRLAPGLQVARISAGTWSIGIRGFADRTARSMLVLIDGRAVYSPLFAGTYWESQDTVMADIDRIEVIRGPGGTLWGANAVNGIINIITKSSKDTQGTYLTAGGGSTDRGFAAARYGGTNGRVSYRGYIKAFDRSPGFHPDDDNYDGWRAAQAGFRSDWTLDSERTVTLQGDAYRGTLGERPTVTSFTAPFTRSFGNDATISGANVLARLTSRASTRGQYQFQLYYDRTNRDEIPIAENRDTGDIDFQHRWQLSTRNSMVWGAGYRVSTGRIRATPPSGFTPAKRTDNLFTAFIQDQTVLRPDKWSLTYGAKFEHNDYSGFEIQPTIRLLWTPDATNTVWAAVTRAVRTPSRVETDYTTASLVSAAGTPTFFRLIPNPEFDAERLVAYEAGYRFRAADRVYVTMSAFVNDLENTLSTELFPSFVEPPDQPVRLILPVQFKNGLYGDAIGTELTTDWRPTSWWRANANYSYLTVAMTKDRGGQDVSLERRYEGGFPHHQLQTGMSFDFSPWSFDWLLRSVSALRSPAIPGYTTTTIRGGWRINANLDLALVGQDLFDDHHLEWLSGSGPGIEVRRSVYARLTWRR